MHAIDSYASIFSKPRMSSLRRLASQVRRGTACGAALIALVGSPVANASAVVPIDTMPGRDDFTSVYYMHAFFEWFELAAGFDLPTFGTITKITTGIRGNGGLGPFYVGIASNELIGNPAVPTSFDAPPGSLVEYTTCLSAPNHDDRWSSCDYADAAADFWGVPDIRLDLGEDLILTPDLYVPSGGTYWVYTRFRADDVGAFWTTNLSIPAALVAERNGYCISCDDRPDDRTFFRVALAGAPALRVEFEPGRRVPEPGTLALLSIGVMGLAVLRRRTKHHPQASI